MAFVSVRSPDRDPERMKNVQEFKAATEQIVDLCDQMDGLVRKLRCVQHKHEWSFVTYNLILAGRRDLDHLDLTDEDLKDMVQKSKEYIFHLNRAFTYLTYALNHCDQYEIPEIPA